MLLASEGAVVVDDLGGGALGEGADAVPRRTSSTRSPTPAARPSPTTTTAATGTGAEALVNQAVDTFGGLDILINNAGILRDKMSFNMTEDEWDAVIKVHLKGHFAPSHHAATYWRTKSKETRRAGQRHRQHVVRVRALRQRRPGQLRGGEGGHRVPDDRHRPRARRAPACGSTPSHARRAHPAHREPRRRAPTSARRCRRRCTPGTSAAGAGWLASDLSDGISGQVLKIEGGVVRSCRAGAR